MKTVIATSMLALCLAMGALGAPAAQESNAGGEVPTPRSATDVPSPVAGAPVGAEYAAAVGRLAYIWGWPLVNMHNRHAMFGTAPHPGLLGGVPPVAPVGRLAMLSVLVHDKARRRNPPRMGAPLSFHDRPPTSQRRRTTIQNEDEPIARLKAWIL